MPKYLQYLTYRAMEMNRKEASHPIVFSNDYKISSEIYWYTIGTVGKVGYSKSRART